MTTISDAFRQALRTTTALALFASSSTVWAQTAAPAQPIPVTTPTVTATDEEVRPIEPDAGRIRSFAGDVSGTAGRIRSFEGSAVGSAGRIRSFAGNLQVFAGRIRSFQTETVPSTGTNTAFWGSLNAIGGNSIPLTGKISSFQSSFESRAAMIRVATTGLRAVDGSLRSYSQAKTSYDIIANEITSIVNLSNSTFGAAFEKQTGQKFETAFKKRLLSKYGIDLANRQSFNGLNEVDIELFLLDWKDNLMNHSGRDQVDYWMKMVNWSPSMTQQVTGGSKAKIGLMDYTVTSSETSNILSSNGISSVDGIMSSKTAITDATETVAHGSAVISLIGSAHDGRGIMGMAPNAEIVSYNPFDSTYTAGWDDIRTGLNLFATQGVSVVNMSLGVPGWALNEGWNGVFGSTDAVAWYKNPQLFVLSAGNDGVTQPRDIEWAASRNRAIIVVGSVDPFKNISVFSNTPGNTCLLTNGVCASPADRLMNRFIVAPGEFILVSDGAGGVTRMSGTSFAAPLVSGTATLIADRWSWLTWRPNDIADIIFKTATDLGAPGVDAVYGHGMLNVTAALSPINFNNLFSWSITADGKYQSSTPTSIASTAIASKKSWEASSAYLTVYERTLSSFRDFVIPLSSKLIGQTNNNDGRMFQAYLQSRFWDWVVTQPKTVSTTNANFADRELVSPVFISGNLKAHFGVKPREYRPGIRQSNMPFETAMSFQTANDRFGFQFGTGSGAAALGENNAFGLASDYDINNGGVNPLLSLASGSGYASARFSINDSLSISTGITGQKSEHFAQGASLDVFRTLLQLQPYKASANTVTVKYQPTQWMTATASYTKLHENTALLGVQSLDASDFAGGNVTDAGTYGLDLAVTPDLAFAASATIGRTRSGDKARQRLAVGPGGAVTTAFQIAVTKTKLFDGNDSARITLSQPLYIESGSINFDSVQVVDRQTGELGVVTQKVGLQSGKRSYVTEAIYRRSLLDGKAELNLFGRARIGGETAQRQDASLTVGAGLHIAF